MTSTHALLKKYNIRPKKRLGQHFLHADPTIKKIVSSLEIDDDFIIEIGPGPGIMTKYIAEKAKHLYAIDTDSAMIDVASEELSEYKNIEWVNDDILNVDLAKLLPKKKIVKIIGNLPYNISSQIIFWMIDNRDKISSAVIMLQKEVALRICAKSGGRDYGILSVISQAFSSCKKLFDVSAGNFIPPPEVTSSVIMMDFQNVDYDIDDEAHFKKVVKAAFGKRRKTIRNSLLGAKFKAEVIDASLFSSDIDPKRRAETLSINEFIELSRHIS
ncbi:MAG: ribosomal RNA small subunit methyltransferase A [Deltaproteobacteria bacterium]|jgi:16S rRNA (adenine1518-N6/adenine1519-N6)-dimethyltransferase|nr:ribosomal RNA small subunit methyltransferase A [Deltaproteobacteria bacterium]